MKGAHSRTPHKGYSSPAGTKKEERPLREGPTGKELTGPLPSDTGGGGEINVAIKFCGESSPVVAANNGKMELRFLVDTGPKVSLLKESVFRELSKSGRTFNEHLGGTRTRLTGITGKELETRGCYLIPLGIGKTLFCHSFSICNDSAMIPVSGILGQDVVRAHGLDQLTTKGWLCSTGKRFRS